MGYDMRWVEVDPDEAGRVKAAQERFEALVRERDALPKEEGGKFNYERAKDSGLSFDDDSHYDGRTDRFKEVQARVHQAFDAMYDEEKSYFRLNIHGMSVFRNVMETFGMGFYSRENHPEWPKPEDFGLTAEQAEAREYPDEDSGEKLTAEQVQAADRYLEKHEEILSWHGEDRKGIPMHKFGSNDGWHVTAQEAGNAVEIWYDILAKAEETGEVDALIGVITEHTRWPEGWTKWIDYLEGASTHGGFKVW